MLEVNQLSKKYGNRKILNNVSIGIKNSGITFILGKNGSGKSTFIKCLLMLESYSGSISYDGMKYNNDSECVFAIYDDSSLYDNLTGIQNLVILTNRSVNEIVEKSRDYFTESLLYKKCKTYSHGEKKKVFLIAIELIKPKYILMDEVSSGLDYETLLHLKQRLKQMSKHSSLILTGHQFDFYRSIIDDIIILSNGSMEILKYDSEIPLEVIYGSI